MKNKFFYIIIFFIILTQFSKNLVSDEVDIQTTEINILNEGKLLTGKNGFDLVSSTNIKISGNEFSYNKESQELKAKGNIIVKDDENKIVIKSEIIEYKKKQEEILLKEDTEVSYKENYTLFGKEIFYLKNKNIIYSKNKAKIEDKNNNVLIMDSFKIDQLNNTITANKVVLKDKDQNNYFMDIIKYKLDSEEFVGKDIYLKLGSQQANDDNYRFKGRAIIDDNEQTLVNKGVFTTCKESETCPPWRIEADEIKHNKKKKLINYKNAWLKVYDVPVFYFPRFFHPDPTVERQSGFLIPTFADSKNLGASFTLPYYHVLAANKDITFSPRFFEANKAIFQSEYRQVNKNSFHITDFSFFNHSDNTRSHLFINSKHDLITNKFEKSFLEFNFQQTNNDTYLNTYNISSPIISSKTILNSSIDYKAYDDNFSLNVYGKVIEDLSKSKNRYEYVYPYLNISKSINNLKLSSAGYNKKYDTNKDIFSLTNNLQYDSYDKYFKTGLKSNWNFILKNANITSDTDEIKSTNNLLSAFHYNFNLPLINKGELLDSIIDPKMSVRFSPNKTKNMNNVERRMDYNNIFDLNRISMEDTLEGGESITMGFDYKLVKSNDSSELLKFGLAQVFRNNKNEDLPTKSTLGSTSSDVFGNLSVNSNDTIKLDYVFNLDDQLSKANYKSLDMELRVNKFVTSFEYLDDEISSDKNNYSTINIGYNINDNHSVKLQKRENRKINLTEYNNLIYEYRNDCLKASIEYNKTNYTNNDLKPEEEIMFTVTLGSFGTITSPTY